MNGLDWRSALVLALVSVLIFLVYLLAASASRRLVVRYGARRGVMDKQARQINKLIGALWLVALVLALGFVWGFQFSALYAASTGIFALIGIGFFAVWSVLSNITSSVIIFFQFPMNIGDTVQLPENEYISGEVVDITLFHIIIRDAKGHTLAVPNNVAMQKILKIEKRG